MTDSCVEVARTADDIIAIRDSKNPDQAPLLFTRDELKAWIQGVKLGDFDDLLT